MSFFTLVIQTMTLKIWETRRDDSLKKSRWGNVKKPTKQL